MSVTDGSHVINKTSAPLNNKLCKDFFWILYTICLPFLLLALFVIITAQLHCSDGVLDPTRSTGLVSLTLSPQPWC